MALGGLLAVVLGSCGVAGGGSGLLAGTAGREMEEKKLQKWGKRAGFWLILDPIFSSIRPSTPPLFIEGGRG